MRKRLTNILICPNNHKSDLKIFGTKVHRNGTILHNLDDELLLDDDDIEEGIIVSDSSKTAYPISEFIAILLSDTDIDTNHHHMLLEKVADKCPDFYNTILKSTLARITKLKDTSEGKWNREEMKYYDNEVNTPEQREQMLHSIKNMPIWRIFQPRTKYIIQYLKEQCAGQTILEIGSGNSRTVSWSFNPANFNFKYVGSDISFKRLMVAKKSIPEGDFFQASALNLPFKNDSFYAVISFGMLHHLPDPVKAVSLSTKLVKTGGFIAFHEPIIKPDVYLPGLTTLKKLTATYEHSEHDGKIDLEATLTALKENNFKTIFLTKKISTIRAFSETIIKKISRKILLNKFIISSVENIDEIFLHTLSKVSKKFAPSTVYAVFKKE